MTEAEWLACEDFETLFRHLETAPLLTQRKLRLFEVACCRLFVPLLSNAELTRVVEVAESYADGNQSVEELASACQLARVIETNADGNEALDYGARTVVEATSPDHIQYHYGTLDFVDHAHEALFYATRRDEVEKHAEWVAHVDATGVIANRASVAFLRDIFGNPFRPVAFDPAWRTDTAVSLARGMYDSRKFGAMPILADALQDAGCEHEQVLMHCRDANQVHVRGCWVCDLVLGKD